MRASDCLLDLRYAGRQLRRGPGFTAVAILTVALGMGATMAVLTLLNTVALSPLPVPDPNAVVHIGERGDGGRQLFSYRDYLDYRSRNDTLFGLAAFNKAAVVLGDLPPGEADDESPLTNSGTPHAFGLIVTASYFELLGARTAMGRTFSPDEERVPAQGAVVVLSHSFWQRRLHADSAIIGQSIRLAGRPFTVVGVMAPDFVGTEPQIPDFWAPVTMRDALVPGWYARTWSTDREARCLALLGRLRPGVTLAQAQADLRVIERQLAAAFHRDEEQTAGVRVTSGATFYNPDDYWPLAIPVFLAVGLVLVIACANVANLLLSRATSRRREIAIRLAVGSSRGRLIRQLLAESLLLAVLGGIGALTLALVTIRVLTPRILSALPLPDGLAETIALSPQLDGRILALTLLVSLATGLLFGLVPALQATADVNAGLRDEHAGRGLGVRSGRIRDGLVVLQVAVSIVLLVCAGLVTRNVRNLGRLDAALRTADVHVVAAGLAGGAPRERDAQMRRELSTRLAEMPGVGSIAEVERVPLSGGTMRSITIALDDQRSSASAKPARAAYNLVSPEYFETLNVRVTRGRIFTRAETHARAAVVVVSESTARRFWPGLEPIGRRITFGTRPDAGRADDGPYLPHAEVVGVVADVRSDMVWRRDETMLYAPFPAAGTTPASLLVRMQDGGNPREAIRQEARRIAENLEVSVRPLDATLDFQMAPFRALAALAGGLGTLALVMASLGIYGVISYLAAQRTREFGIRLALGATPGDLLRSVLGSGMRLAAAGLLAGTIGAAGAARLIANVLTDTDPLDPLAFGGVAIGLTAVAALACAVPAARAARVNPLTSLRRE